MVPLPGPAGSPRLLLLPASAAASAAQPATAASPPRKRQRLAHLSPEEKALRRKLKNRVAAQSARDRKKARMGELERQAVELEAENQKLLAENQLLRERAHSLALENQELRLRLGLPALESHGALREEAAAAGGGAAPLGVKVEITGPHKEEEKEEEEEEEGGSLSPRSATGSAESAALRLRVPLQQEQAQQSPALGVRVDPSTWMWTHLILQTLSLDPEMFLGAPGLDPACLEKLQPPEEASRGGGGSLPASPRSPLGASPSQLEAINELIRFDHEYTKPFFLEIVSQVAGPADVLVRIEEAAPLPLDGAPLEPPVSVKEEPSEGLFPELGISHLLASDQWPLGLLEAASDSSYEGSSSPFSDLASPLEPEYGWEEAFAKELFPQLISV